MEHQPLLSRAKRWSKPPVTTMLLGVGYYRWQRRRLPGNRAVILAYHHVSAGRERTQGAWAPFQRGVPQERFDRQMRFLRTTMSPLPLREVVAAVRKEKALPPRAIVVTFDDGYLDNFTVAYPILKKYGIPATVFVSTGFVETGQAFWWDQVYFILRNTSLRALDRDLLASIPRPASSQFQRSYPLRTWATRFRAAETVIDLLQTLPHEGKAAAVARLRSALGIGPDGTGQASSVMTWAHLREMNHNGITIESHTHTHPVLGLGDPSAVEEELSISKSLIEERLDQPVEGLAYPDGRQGTYNVTTMKIAEAVGYRFGCVAFPARVSPGVDPFSLGRLPLGNASFPVFVRDLLWGYARG